MQLAIKTHLLERFLVKLKKKVQNECCKIIGKCDCSIFDIQHQCRSVVQIQLLLSSNENDYGDRRRRKTILINGCFIGLLLVCLPLVIFLLTLLGHFSILLVAKINFFWLFMPTRRGAEKLNEKLVKLSCVQHPTDDHFGNKTADKE
ncbi:hypothetical protein T03_8133 [Trichinella britovi]|uniref:Transmembrane protein n=1 Tax=Trichinella britovi TaxID=45882 RepID=A0A0V1CLV9_TRIBR|nr:hypothetical protein T03_8133 [Trichinella britovi]